MSVIVPERMVRERIGRSTLVIFPIGICKKRHPLQPVIHQLQQAGLCFCIRNMLVIGLGKTAFIGALVVFFVVSFV